MSNYTYDQLEQALGPTYKLVSYGDKSQARIQTADGFDLAFFDFKDGRIEAGLNAKWRAAAESSLKEGPDTQALAAARQEIAEELAPDWEIAGFTVSEDGALDWYSYAKDSETKIPMYRVDVHKDVATLEDAVKTVQWVRTAETETWL
jgi:hypothetical protein